MLFLRICFDKPGSDVRDEILKDHRQFVAHHLRNNWDPPVLDVLVVQGGPMYAGTQPDRALGSFIVLEAESIELVRKFHEADPFTREGLFERVNIVRWDRHIGNDNQTEYIP